MKELKTKRLRMVPLTVEQLRQWIDLEKDEHMKNALGEMLDGCLKHPEQHLWYTNWQILLLDSGESIGSLSFKGGPVNGEVEIGYGLDEPYWGKGYTTEAAKRAIEWAFSDNNVYFVTAETEPDNTRSKRVLEKLGFKEYGVGLEGPRFEKEKDKMSWLAVFMCMGLSLGMCFGNMYDSIGTGLSLGVAIGVAIGAAIDASDNKRREASRKARKEKNS